VLGKETLYLTPSNSCLVYVLEYCKEVIVIIAEPASQVFKICDIFNCSAIYCKGHGKY